MDDTEAERKIKERAEGRAEGFYYGWVVCAVCTILLFITVGTASNALSVFMPYIRSGYGLTNAQTSFLVTMRCTSSFVGMLAVEKYYNRFGFRKGMGISALVCAAAYLIYSFASSYRFFIAGAIVAGFSYGLGSMIPVSIIMNRWFVKHRALVIGICSAGSSIAVIVLPPVLTSIIVHSSLRAGFLFSAGMAAAAALLVFAFVKSRPQDMGLEPLGWREVLEKPHEHLPKEGDEPHVSKTLSKRDWILMGTVAAVMGAVANPGFMHLSMLFTGEGYGPMTVAAVLSIVGIVMAVFKVLFGETSDIIGGKKATAIFFTILVAGFLLCCASFTRSVPLAISTAVVIGVGYPVSAVGIPVWSADLVSHEHYGELVWKLQLIYAAGAMAFAGVPGIIADRAGGYIPVYAIFAALTLMTFFCVMYVYRDVEAGAARRRPRRADSSVKS